MKNQPFHSFVVMVFIFTLHANAHPYFKVDSTQKIIHVIDGRISEWSADKFEKDPSSTIYCAEDYDATNLYLAMRIPDQQTQMKMATLGMNLFLDKKGKKKENTGIEFPAKKEGSLNAGRPPSGDRPSTSGNGNNTQPIDMNAMHDRMANLMFLIKTFGFEGQDDKSIFFAMQSGGISIAYDWDEANNLILEYLIPISYIGDQHTLQDKPLSIGWVINGIPESGSTNFSNASPGATGGGGGGGGRGGASGRGTNSNFPTLPPSAGNNGGFKQQSFWTKYTLHF